MTEPGRQPEIAALRFVARMAVSHLKGTGTCKEAWLTVGAVAGFGMGACDLRYEQAVTWATAWHLYLEKKGVGRIKVEVHHPFEYDRRFAAPAWDVLGGIQFLLGANLVRTDIMRLVCLDRIATLISSDTGNWVMLLGDVHAYPDPFENLPAKRFWTAWPRREFRKPGDPTLMNHVMADAIADGCAPQRQAELQIEMDRRVPGPTEQVAPTSTIPPVVLRRAVRMAEPCSYVQPSYLDEEPARYPAVLEQIRSLVLYGIRPGTWRRTLQLRAGMNCPETVEVLDMLLGTEWRMGALPASGNLMSIAFVVTGDEAAPDVIFLKAPYLERRGAPRFDKAVPQLPSVDPDLQAEIRHYSGNPSGASLLPFTVSREFILAALVPKPAPVKTTRGERVALRRIAPRPAGLPTAAERYPQTQAARDELERLVWSMPTSQVAKHLGVSDVALGKRCDKLGVSKPERGFWAKVQAGKLPHPQGKPIDPDSLRRSWSIA